MWVGLYVEPIELSDRNDFIDLDDSNAIRRISRIWANAQRCGKESYKRIKDCVGASVRKGG